MSWRTRQGKIWPAGKATVKKKGEAFFVEWEHLLWAGENNESELRVTGSKLGKTRICTLHAGGGK